jgi:hypothetical protein
MAFLQKFVLDSSLLYVSRPSHFGFQFEEIFVIENDSPTPRIGEKPRLRLWKPRSSFSITKIYANWKAKWERAETNGEPIYVKTLKSVSYCLGIIWKTLGVSRFMSMNAKKYFINICFINSLTVAVLKLKDDTEKLKTFRHHSTTATTLKAIHCL